MRVTVLVFAGLRQRIGAAQVEIELSEPATVGQLRDRIRATHPQVGAGVAHCRVAVDHEFVGDDEPILAGQEVALIPPVSGGAPIDQVGQRARLRDTALSLAEVIAAVEHRGAGGVATFTGNVREHSRGKVVQWLEYEAYPAMAVAKMDEIAVAVEAEIPGSRVALQHRVGRLEIGETAVVIAASAPHRDEAFRACREVIERLKQDVPIWKKEIDSAGGEWIGQGP
ncbi:molybdenum cofactor biosynthesis protein [Enhygromyxa salina]|uniref:Molybdopterin synthase catalytic subunit n=1 Tax=Enhygromyxa salina TaxID=215803 RepID=A0A2S9YX74_9BACT|nr:molybdenum cofactor biosynthesis protein MoaE [Enhygromyxa salina]PRQ09698.1 Molybdopterin synthase catalytic subunit 1 [Enhygromyxa salina]